MPSLDLRAKAISSPMTETDIASFSRPPAAATWALPIQMLGSFTTFPNGLCYTEELSVNQLYGQAYQHPLYIVIHWEGPMDGTMRFNDIYLRYHLTVSPAPGVATFNDVPTNHPFFQYVEALASSGITAGCGNGNFCPDQPLTRGQMAVFLSKALGLNWAVPVP